MIESIQHIRWRNVGEFGLSQPVRRREDWRLLSGQGRFCDDLNPPGLAHAQVVRAPVACAPIRSVDVERARQAPGVLAIYTGADLEAAGVGAIPTLVAPKPKPGTVFRPRLQPALARDCVRFAGEGVAFVVADTLEQARAAAELVVIEYQPQAAITACDAAASPGAPQLWPDVPGNIGFDWELGDPLATGAAFARAARVVKLDVVNNRVLINAMETRGAIGSYDSTVGKLTLHTGTQMPHKIRDQLATVFGLRADQLRVLVQDVGGGFGGKNSLFPEQVLVLHAARELGRPVKWIAERSEGLLSDFAGRDNVSHAELALDAGHRFLGLRVSTYANLGAYTAGRGAVSPTNMAMASNTYRLPAIHVEVKGVFTNTAPTDPYRGAGRPEILYLIERLVDVAARDLGLDRVELRRLNYIRPGDFPYATPTGLTYDACDFERIMDAALAAAQWHDFTARRAQAAQAGKLRGIGFANYVERCGGGGGLSEEAVLRFDADGGVSLFIGSMANGQGHETAYSQIVNERLGLPFERIRIVQGDTDTIATGLGTGGSWSIPMGGGAIWQAADLLLEKARLIAAERLEVADADLEFDSGSGAFRVAGTDLRLPLAEIARLALDPAWLPPGMEAGLNGAARYAPNNHTFPYGCHVCEVDLDPETGKAAIVAYTAVHDFGRVLNPLLLAGQVHGGVAQGIGQALLEQAVYDADGQLLSGSLLDYCLPRADDLPFFAFRAEQTPAPHNPFGAKGCGEAGAAGSPPALINAIIDALAPYQVRHLDMPATPEKLWRILAQAPR
ncbi:MAG: xanthine dehydrogenase family protein molybdopterin-binding subunit [Gammaproteobacteria bacterium]